LLKNVAPSSTKNTVPIVLFICMSTKCSVLFRRSFLANFTVHSGASKDCMGNSVPYVIFNLSIEGGHVDGYQMFTFYTILLQNLDMDFNVINSFSGAYRRMQSRQMYRLINQN